jgi:CubicO group peptidase (beta-lactamase class C family)
LEKASARLALQPADLNGGRLFHRAVVLTARPGCSEGGDLCSTAEDYYRSCQMMLNKGELNGVRLLSRKSVELMTQEKLSPLP